MDINNLTYADAVRVFETPGRIAEVFGIRPQAVYQWHERLPRGRRFELAVILRGILESEAPEQAALKARIEALVAGQQNAA